MSNHNGQNHCGRVWQSKPMLTCLCLMDQGGGFMSVEENMTGTLRKESRGHEPVIVAMHETGQGFWQEGDISGTIRAEGENRPSRPSNVIAFTQNQAGDVLTGNVMHNIGTNSNATGRNAANVQTKMQVRRLTPTECERLQGFPDGHTAIKHKGKPAADGPRYKAIGNSMAVPVMAWIGKRIQMVDEIMQPHRAEVGR